MSKQKENELAYPHKIASGLTKLEYFSGLALQGILAGNKVEPKYIEVVANRSVCFAKALIEELEKVEEQE